MRKNTYFYRLYLQSESNMTEKESALYSHYIIDGVRMDTTPAELLDECMDYEDFPYKQEDEFDDIIDESTEPPLSSFVYDNNMYEKYLRQVMQAVCEERSFRMLYPDHFTRLQISKALLGRLWSEGHFRLGDLRLWAQWEWNTRPLGNMAAFYHSAESASEYIYGLGVKLEDYVFLESDGESNVKFFAWLDDAEDASDQDDGNDNHKMDNRDEVLFKSSPYESRHPWIGDTRKCPHTIVPDKKSWLIYIPFDTCRFKIGGSLMAQTNFHNGGKAPSIEDPDYFIDCYEVVRELTEDGIIISGITVADGGIAAAAEKMAGKSGIALDLRGILASYQDSDICKVLFGEIPGAIIQISDENYDYVDSQFILQDIAYYPIGHPDPESKGIRICTSSRTGVAEILLSLLGQASEGED